MSTSKHNVYDELKQRGALADATPDARLALSDPKNNPVTCYVGFDPSAPSLHIGNLIPLMGMRRMKRAGHKVIALIGTGTGMIGDPSGRTEERQLLEQKVVEANADAIQEQIENLLDKAEGRHPVKVMRNGDWLGKLNLLEFLRDTGKHFSVNRMVKRDSVRERLEREEGISFTEFSYQLIQAYDFLQLYDKEGCTMQMGGSDQWGNIVSGVDLIRRMHINAPPAHGLTYPLVTGADGTKFGKTMMGATPTLDAKVTSPYKLYQLFRNVADADVFRYLKLFTSIDGEDLAELVKAAKKAPARGDAQEKLAREIVEMVHGKPAMQRVQTVSLALFAGNLHDLTKRELEEAFDDAPSGRIERTKIESGGLTAETLILNQGNVLMEYLATPNRTTLHSASKRAERAKIFKSRGELQRVAKQGGLYLNKKRLEDPETYIVGSADILDGGIIVFRRGKKDYYLIKVE